MFVPGPKVEFFRERILYEIVDYTCRVVPLLPRNWPNHGIEGLRRSVEKYSLEVAEGCSTTAENQIGVYSAIDEEQQLF